MTKGHYPRHTDTMPMQSERTLLGLFVSCGFVVFPAMVALVAATQFAIEQPKIILAIIGIN